MLTTGVSGQIELRKVQGLFVTSETLMVKALAANARRDIAPIKREIPAEALTRMPSGYGPVLARSTKVSTRVTSGGGLVKGVVRVVAMGKAKERDVRATDRGVLRHPLFGNRSSWHAQRVRRGWVSDPIEWTRKRVYRGAEQAVDATIKTITKG